MWAGTSINGSPSPPSSPGTYNKGEIAPGIADGIAAGIADGIAAIRTTSPWNNIQWESLD